MLQNIKKNAKSFVKSLPLLDSFIQNNIRFKTELALIKGKHKNYNLHPSIIHFSLNKAATQYIKSILKLCATNNGLVHVGIHEYAFHSKFPFLDHLSEEEMIKYHHIFKKTGYLYSAFGGMIEGIPFLEEYKIILVVRDPRDILVSDYFSTSYSHPVPNKAGSKYKKFMEKRKEAKHSNIDDFVIKESDRILNIFSKYEKLLIAKYQNTYVTTYEKMVSNFEDWLNQLIKYCEFEVNEKLFLSIMEKNQSLKPKSENINKHIRKGQPRDFINKLKPETIELLNKKFASILKRYNYETNIENI